MHDNYVEYILPNTRCIWKLSRTSTVVQFYNILRDYDAESQSSAMKQQNIYVKQA